MDRIAALITCFNRKEKTLKCLRYLYEYQSDIDVYLVDDGSTDGTSSEVAELFPKVELISGTGRLFWNRGMHLAWQVAAGRDYDFYLWLNNDVYLYEGFLKQMMEIYGEYGTDIIVTGVVESKDRKEILYGGYARGREIISPLGVARPVAMLNGNIVLVSRRIFQKLGNLDSFFHHDLGDYDYGLRAIKSGIKIFTTRNPVACGERNFLCRERLNRAGIVDRFRFLYSPLGSNPVRNFYFRWKHQTVLNAILYFIFQHFLNLLPDPLNVRIFGTRYQ